MNKCLLFSLFLLCLPFKLLFSQSNTLNGYIYDKSSGETLLGANIKELQTQNGTVSNDFGYFSLKIPRDTAILRISYVGYIPVVDTIVLEGNKTVNFNLDPNVELETVEITEETSKDLVKQSQMSKVKMEMEEVKKLPRLFGEANVMRAAQLMPGIRSGNEGTSGLLVRGGSPDQNLMLLDGVPLYHVNHLGGFFSVFNADAIKSMEIYKGGFPARFGGRLSSVVDIRMKDGNMKEFTGQGNIGLLSSKVSVEGPIIQDTTSFMLSARRSYIDLLTRPISSAASDGNNTFGYSFHDINAKVNHKFSDKNRLYASFYLGDDRVSNKSEYGNGESKLLTAWGNLLGSLRWNHIFNEDLFGNFTANFTRYRFKIEREQKIDGAENFFQYKSHVRDWSLSADFDFYPTDDHSIKFGAKGIYHIFRPGKTSYEGNRTETNLSSDRYENPQVNLYAEDNWEITNKLKANIGVHSSVFFMEDDAYYSVQPRVSGRYLLNNKSSVKASYATMRQFVHLLTSSSATLPTDLWVPATKDVSPQESQQVAVGYSRTINMLDAKFQLNLESYYKTMDNLISYKEGTNFFGTSNNWEESIETGGQGTSYGVELRLQKKTGNFSGWLGYTLAKTTRKFENINFGERYPYRYDRRHDFSIALTYDVNEKISLSANWVYGTGDAVSLPIKQYNAVDLINPGNEPFSQPGNRPGIGTTEGRSNVSIYRGKNSFRMAPYHRLDVSVSFNKKTSWGERSWNVGLYNAYNRKNPYSYFFQYKRDGGKALKKFTLFPIIPSVSYSFKF